ncbi:MAG: L-seryl-tRNA(Sec) selenium transferase, partial [Rubripirellula sp.]|nr:L-seryl-tRNA(Sec) selenium transferase [Rubripirellula sp.]
MPDPIQLRTIPSVDRLLRSELLEPLGLLYPHSTLVMWARGAIEEYRDKIQRAEQLPKEDPVKDLVSRIIAKERIYAGAKIRAVINATGVILHTNLGRAPLAKRAVQRIVDAAGTANVEMNLNTGKRNHRGQHCVDLLCQLTKCED